jgi:hypothetical protein
LKHAANFWIGDANPGHKRSLCVYVFEHHKWEPVCRKVWKLQASNSFSRISFSWFCTSNCCGILKVIIFGLRLKASA